MNLLEESLRKVLVTAFLTAVATAVGTAIVTVVQEKLTKSKDDD